MKVPYAQWMIDLWDTMIFNFHVFPADALIRRHKSSEFNTALPSPNPFGIQFDLFKPLPSLPNRPLSSQLRAVRGLLESALSADMAAIP